MAVVIINFTPAVRADDPVTCIEPKSRANGAARLLNIYALHDVTDEEAVRLLLGRPATLADEGIRRRASDLRALGWIVATGETRANDRGRQRIICAITDKGRDAHMKLFVNDEGDNQ